MTADDQAVPLARLLAMSYRLLIDSLHTRLREQGWTDVRPAFGFVLLATRDRATTSTELATVLSVSKQAASKLIDAMEEAGFVSRSPGVRDARERIVELADRGHRLLTAVEQIYRDLEAEWVTVIGNRGVELTRRNLSRVVLAAHGGVFPSIRPTP
ncbi:MAG: MarR family transcriptional regulator [Ilumatobacteraceae bacterium]